MSLTTKQTIKGTVNAKQTVNGKMLAPAILDETLTKEGYAADSKAVGDALGKKAVGKAYISNNKDLNTVTESGMYRLGGSLVNAPSGASYGQLLVIHGGGDSIAQLVFDFTMARMWVRTGAPADVGGAGTWTDWAQCYTTAKKPTASDVGARPNTWMPNASDVGAHPNTWLPTLEQIGAAPALDWSHLKWYVMGDSLTAQDNAFTNKRYYDFVREKTGIQVIVDGIGGTGYGAGVSNGESYYDRVQNIPDDVDIVTIFGSGNDIRYAESANMEIYNTLSWLCLERPSLRVIVVPPAPWLGYNKREDPWKAYCDRLQLCALTCNFRYVSDMYDCPPFNPNFTGHMESFFTTDPEEGIHPDENGHKALAPYFYNALLQELAFKV